MFALQSKHFGKRPLNGILTYTKDHFLFVLSILNPLRQYVQFLNIKPTCATISSNRTQLPYIGLSARINNDC